MHQLQQKTFVQVMIALLILTYAFSLIVSTTHLAELYANYDRNAGPISVGLAVALELSAFLLSITSTALAGLVTKWASGAATFALLLVWFGNGYSMYNSAPDKPLWVTVLLSCFVPVGTFGVGKVLGSLIHVRATFGDEVREGPLLVQAAADIQRLQATSKPQIRGAEMAVQATEQPLRVGTIQPTATAADVATGPTSINHTAPKEQPSTMVSMNDHEPLERPVTENTVDRFWSSEQVNRVMEHPLDSEPPRGAEVKIIPEKFKLSSLSVPQREALTWLRQAGPSSADEVAEYVSRPLEVVERTLDHLVDRKAVVEDNGIFQAIV